MDFLLLILKPWPSRGLSFILGALGTLAFAPVFLFPALLLSLSCIWFLLDQNIENKASISKLFFLGWWFGLGHFTAGLYWITYALSVDLDSFWWLIPFALFGIPSILALFTGLTFSLTKLWPFKGISRAVAFAAIWVTVEWIRGHIFTGFPWNLLGYTWAFSLEISQVASLVGVYGLTLFAILLALSLNTLLSRKALERNLALFLGICVLAAWFWDSFIPMNKELLLSPSESFNLIFPRP
jgi:apolipoprotein N-acyltransferase